MTFPKFNWPNFVHFKQ